VVVPGYSRMAPCPKEKESGQGWRVFRGWSSSLTSSANFRKTPSYFAPFAIYRVPFIMLSFPYKVWALAITNCICHFLYVCIENISLIISLFLTYSVYDYYFLCSVLIAILFLHLWYLHCITRWLG
jgi:hypothetical protein